MKSIRCIKSIKKEKKRIEEEEEKKLSPNRNHSTFGGFVPCSLGIFQVTNATLRLCFFVSGLYLQACRQFLPNAFQGLLLLKEE